MLNVLVVDDSVIIRRTLTTKLEEMGYTVVAQAKSGKEAVLLYKEHIPDLVTMDITMPIMNGIEALKKIIKEHSDAKIIMVTSHGEEHLVMEAITNGARGYILKPVNNEQLTIVINKVFPELEHIKYL